MRAHLRAELITLTTTRGPYGLVASAVAVVALATWSTMYQLRSDVEGGLVDQRLRGHSRSSQRKGGLPIRDGDSAVLTTRRRGTVLDAKAVIVALVGAAMVIGQAWAVIGAAVGMAVRHQVATDAGVVIWILAVENLGSP